MARRHAIDVTNFDLEHAASAVHQLSTEIAQRAINLAKDATYITVGFGLLVFQRAQVQRREFERSLRD